VRWKTRLLALTASVAATVAAVEINVVTNLLPRSWDLYLAAGSAGTGMLIVVALTITQSVLSLNGEKQGKTPQVSKRRKRSARRSMLEKLRKIYVNDMLDPAIYRGVPMPIGLEQREGLVSDPWAGGAGAKMAPLPGGTRLADLLRAGTPAVLLLGEPGSGKTIMLLELLRDLLAEAEADRDQPLPVLFRLASWRDDTPLADWLVSQLREAPYRVSGDLARAWIADDYILPLLDGLDEVPLGHRLACANAIDAFRASRGTLPLVLVSRTCDYSALKISLHMQVALVTKSLTRPQVEDHLERVDPSATGLRAELAADPVLWEFLRTPFDFDIALRACEDARFNQHDPSRNAGGGAREGMISAYAEMAFSGRIHRDARAGGSVTLMLAYMARALAAGFETTFRPREINPAWLPFAHRSVVWLLTAFPFAGLIAGFSYVPAIHGLFLLENFGPLLVLASVTSFLLDLLFVARIDLAAESIRYFLDRTVISAQLALFPLVAPVILTLIGARPAGSSPWWYIEGTLMTATVLYLGPGWRVVAWCCTRVMLAWSGVFPLLPRSELDCATSATLLVNTGAGYSFRHRLLLEYFAGLEVADLPESYRTGGFPAVDIRPREVLAKANALTRQGELDKALSALQYVSTCLPPAEFTSTAFELAVSCKASTSVGRFIAAHRLVVESGHPDLSRRAALRAADNLIDKIVSSLEPERAWLDAAEEFCRLATEPGDQEMATDAPERLRDHRLEQARIHFRNRESEARARAIGQIPWGVW
jgi:hypothetical protein